MPVFRVLSPGENGNADHQTDKEGRRLIRAGRRQANRLWESDIRGFGVRVLKSGLKTFILQYRNSEGIKRRINLGRFGIMTVEHARDLAKIKVGLVVAGEDPADQVRQARKGMTVAEMCDWYLTEARAENILGRKNRPIKASSLNMDESCIRTHIKPLLGNRVVRHLTIADVEQMQADVRNGKTAKLRPEGRGGKTSGGAGVASRCVGTLQAVIGHAKHQGLLAEHPTKGAKKLKSKKFARLFGLVERLLAQKPKDKNKLYSLHAPEVVCISKGKARTPYEFGCKVGIAATNREGLVLAAKAFEDNPYDGHTLSGSVDQAVAMGGVDPDRIYVDKGYRGHDYTGSASVMIAGSRRGLTPTMRRELKRRSAIEPTIGHMKTDGRLDRNFLLGHVGDAVNALLVAAGHNLRLILAKLALWRAFILAALNILMANSDTSRLLDNASRSMR